MLIRVEHGSILELRMDRGPVNALSPELIEELGKAVSDASGDGAHGLVISGREGIFSAGLDVPTLLELDRARMAETWQGFYDLMRALATSPIPVVAAITGHSPAGGAVIALMCDRRVMAAGQYRIGLNEVQVGLPMPPVIFEALALIVGRRRSASMCMEASMLLGSEALRVGLVDEIAPAAEVVERALAWCEEILALPRGPMLETRALGRTPLHGLLAVSEGEEVKRVVESWFAPETQRVLQALATRLRAGKTRPG